MSRSVKVWSKVKVGVRKMMLDGCGDGDSADDGAVPPYNNLASTFTVCSRQKYLQYIKLILYPYIT